MTPTQRTLAAVLLIELAFYLIPSDHATMITSHPVLVTEIQNLVSRFSFGSHSAMPSISTPMNTTTNATWSTLDHHAASDDKLAISDMLRHRAAEDRREAWLVSFAVGFFIFSRIVRLFRDWSKK